MHTIFSFNTLQFIQQGLANKQQHSCSTQGLAEIDEEARGEDGHDGFPGDAAEHDKNTGAVQNGADEKQNSAEAENSHDPGFPGQPSFAEQKACQHTACAVGKHLLGGKRTLPIKKVTDKGGDRTHHEAGLWAEGDGGNDNNSENGFEMGDGEDHTAGNGQCA